MIARQHAYLNNLITTPPKENLHRCAIILAKSFFNVREPRIPDVRRKVDSSSTSKEASIIYSNTHPFDRFFKNKKIIKFEIYAFRIQKMLQLR